MVVVEFLFDVDFFINSCGIFSQSYEVCFNFIIGNMFDGSWFLVGGDFQFISFVNGFYLQIVDLDGCVSDVFIDLEDIEFNLIFFSIIGDCLKIICNEYCMCDECGNIFVDCICVDYIFSELVVLVWNFVCEEDFEFIIEDGNFCLVDVDILLMIGDEFDINDIWIVGGNLIGLLVGCVEDVCLVVIDLIIWVDDIDFLGDVCE